jgi:hypothetical protein
LSRDTAFFAAFSLLSPRRFADAAGRQHASKAEAFPGNGSRTELPAAIFGIIEMLAGSLGEGSVPPGACAKVLKKKFHV